MSYPKDLDFAFVPLRDRRLLLATHLDSAISSNDLDTINKIIKLNHDSWLHKITDEKMMQKMIEKWKMCATVDSSIISNIWGLFECVSASVPIIRICLDYLVDPNVRLSPYDVTLERFGCYTSGYHHDAYHDAHEREHSFWVEEHTRYPNDLRPTTDIKRAKHDELMKIYLEYYPFLKKKCSYKALSDAYDVQAKYIISRITQIPEERVPTLKLIIDTFGHANQPYLADLFMKSCAANNIPVIVCMLGLNPAFHANIQNDIVVDYNIQNEDTTHIENKLNQTIEILNTTIAVLNNIDAEFSNIKSQLDSIIEQTDIKFANIKSQLDNAIEQMRTRTHITHNNATTTVSERKCEYSTEIMKKTKDKHAEIIKKLGYDHAETLAKLNIHYAEIVKKTKDDHAEIIKKTENNHTKLRAIELTKLQAGSAKIIQKPRSSHAETTIELNANIVRGCEIRKKMRADQAEIIAELGADHAKTMAKLRANHIRSIDRVTKDHATEITNLRAGHVIEITKLRAQYQL